MLKIKLEQSDPNSNTWYALKINGEIFDHGIISDNNIETLIYKNFSDSIKQRTYISIEAPNDRSIIIKEISYCDIDVEVKSSGTTDNINEVVNGNFDNLILSPNAGGNREWVFVLEPDETISLWNGEEWYNYQFKYPFELPEIIEDREENRIASQVWYKPFNGWIENYIQTDGSVYSGAWSMNEFEGKGKLVYTDGVILDGWWKKSKFVNGTRYNLDGSIEMGDWVEENSCLVLLNGLYRDSTGTYSCSVKNKEKIQ